MSATNVDLKSFPRANLCHRPTPLEPLTRLTEHLGGAQLFVKRDDCTGLATGGNKTRKLEFLMGEAQLVDATTVITIGGVQSNHARQTAAAAAKLGLKCELVLPRLVHWESDDYETSGNVFLDRLFGAKVHIVDDAEQTRAKVEEIMAAVEAEDGSAYFIPSGGSTPTGSLGYVAAASELTRQANAMDMNIDYVVLAVSSGGTQAGLVTGFTVLGVSTSVFGIAVFDNAENTAGTVKEIVSGTTGLLEMDDQDACDRVRVQDAYLGPGYGQPTDEMVEAVSMAAKFEGLLLDPVYTGKAMAGLIDLVRNGFFKKSDNVVFLHTGGLPSIFPYRDALLPK